MTKRLTKDEFVSKAVIIHGNLYNYELVEYINNATKVTIGCLRHSTKFQQTPAKHLSGQGCPICRYEKSAKGITLSTEDFVREAERVHGSSYSYHSVEYAGTHSPVKIWCNTHESYFEQKPVNHLSGKGCKLCAKEKVDKHISSLVLTDAEFVCKAKMVHGDLYDYSNTRYTRSSELVEIWCNRHKGYFKQTANSHLSGVGCASCARTGYSTNKRGILYVLKCGDITKVGITNLTAEIRAKAVSRSFGSTFNVYKTWTFQDGGLADKVETLVLRYLRSKYIRPHAVFEGSSECFLNVCHEDLLYSIESEAQKLAN